MRPLMRSGERFFSRRAAVLVKLRACSMDRILKQPDHGRHGAVRPVGVMGEDGLHDGVMGVVDPQIDPAAAPVCNPESSPQTHPC